MEPTPGALFEGAGLIRGSGQHSFEIVNDGDGREEDIFAVFAATQEPTMPIGLFFRPKGFTPAIYDNVLKQLDQAGVGFGSAPGRTFHCAMEVDGSIHVFDVWESMAQFEKFGETLLPIMQKAGVDPGEPQIMTVHNVRNG